MLYYPVYHYHSEMVFTPREQYIAVFSPVVFEEQHGVKLPDVVQKKFDEFKAEEPALYAEMVEAIKGFPVDDFLEINLTVPEIAKHGGIIDGLKKLAAKVREEVSTPTKEESAEDSGAN